MTDLAAELGTKHGAFLRRQAEAARAANGRRLVAIAGIPGSGKSTLADAWAEAGGALGIMPFLSLPMDGFHRPNAWLEAHTITRDGLTYTLRQQKGCPESFDVDAFLDRLRRLRAGEPMAWPLYDRALHEAVAGGEPLPASGVFLVEGNYLLLDQPPWREAAALFDARVFLDADVENALAAVLARHQRGGRSLRDALVHQARCDRPNVDLVLGRRLAAEFVVRRDAAWHFGPVEPA